MKTWVRVTVLIEVDAASERQAEQKAKKIVADKIAGTPKAGVSNAEAK